MPQFAELTSPQLGELIAQNPLVILPVGQVEEHGPHLPLNTDAVIAEKAALAAGERLHPNPPTLVLPVIWTGYSGAELAHWPGTIRLRTRTFADLVLDTVLSLVDMGLRKIIILNGHGHHPAILEMVAREVADARGVYIAVADVAKMAAPAVREHRRSAPGGCIHACEFETSLMLHFGAEVDMSKAPKEPFKSPSRFFPGDGFAGSKAAFWSTWGVQRSESGAYGDATVASAETGALFFEGLVSTFVDFARDFHATEAASWDDTCGKETS